MNMHILGVDIGGTGIKGAPVDTETGIMLAPRHRIPTPEAAYPDDVAKVIVEIAHQFGWIGPIGCGFPGVVQNGTTLSAANVNKEWIGLDAAGLFSEATGCPVSVVNDADAAGLAEVTFGAGRGRTGIVLMVTIGTGLGTSLFVNGHLVPNTELGHIEIKGVDAELLASDAARQREDLSWKKWAKRFDLYLRTLERLLWPDLIILGGGAVKKQERFIPLLTVRTEIVPAVMGNDAGIIGAALAARK
jgi:polyphosphate glucokinase